MAKRGIYLFLISFGLVMTVYSSSHSVVIEDSLMVTDVTPVQFCVVWGTSEPASSSLNVFFDAAGTKPYGKAVIESESAKHPPAEDIGVMKVRVGGLKPETHYFFQTKSVTRSDSVLYLYPNSPPFIKVTTEIESSIVQNDIIAQHVSVGDQKPAPGMLVIASVDEASYPVTGWVGDGVPDLWGAIDTNNFYDKETHVNLELEGGEVVNLMLFGGSLGSVETQETIPEETGGMQPLKVAANLQDTDSYPNISPPQDSTDGGSAESGGGGGGSGGGTSSGGGGGSGGGTSSGGGGGGSGCFISALMKE